MAGSGKRTTGKGGGGAAGLTAAEKSYLSGIQDVAIPEMQDSPAYKRAEAAWRAVQYSTKESYPPELRRLENVKKAHAVAVSQARAIRRIAKLKMSPKRMASVMRKYGGGTPAEALRRNFIQYVRATR